jgi:hypothetical protein
MGSWTLLPFGRQPYGGNSDVFGCAARVRFFKTASITKQEAEEILSMFARQIDPYPFGNGHPRFFGGVNSPARRVANRRGGKKLRQLGRCSRGTPAEAPKVRCYHRRSSTTSALRKILEERVSPHQTERRLRSTSATMMLKSPRPLVRNRSLFSRDLFLPNYSTKPSGPPMDSA